METRWSQGAVEMVVVDCPWCAGPAEVRGESVDCQACNVAVEIAADQPAVTLAAA